MLLDVEVALNNRPLDYVEDDIELPILTPSSLLHMQPNALPELEPNHIQDYDQRTPKGAPGETPPKAQG